VAGAALLGLLDEADAGMFYGGADAGGFMADDAQDFAGWRYGFRGGNDVQQQRTAADFVENFGALGLEAGAFAGGHDGYAETLDGHAVMVRRRAFVESSEKRFNAKSAREDRNGFELGAAEFEDGGAELVDLFQAKAFDGA
jgi:hypothetical protein